MLQTRTRHLLYTRGCTFPPLYSTHENADTRMFLHAQQAAPECKSVIIASEDTDVFVIALALHDSVDSNMYIKCRIKNRERYIDVTRVASVLGKKVSKALPALHSFTGCILEVVERSKPWSYWRKMLHIKKHLQRWARNGQFPRTYLMYCKTSHATCMLQTPISPQSMSFATNCSEQSKVM